MYMYMYAWNQEYMYIYMYITLDEIHRYMHIYMYMYSASACDEINKCMELMDHEQAMTNFLYTSVTYNYIIIMQSNFAP